jgi:hypothetical protein
MARRKKHALPFDNRGGVVVLSLRMIKSPTYLSLRPQAKVLMILLQEHWRNEKYVDYGIREAPEKTPCDRRTVTKAFDQLQERGFITCMELAFFSGRTQSKSRIWRLEWLPFNDRPPANTWEN